MFWWSQKRVSYGTGHDIVFSCNIIINMLDHISTRSLKLWSLLKQLLQRFFQSTALIKTNIDVTDVRCKLKAVCVIEHNW